MDLQQQKNDLRNKIKELRSNLTDSEWSEKSKCILSHYFDLDVYHNADIMLAYMSIGREVDLTELINRCLKDGKEIAVPKMIPGLEQGKMEFIFIDSNTNFLENNRRIPEPETGRVFNPMDSTGKMLEIILPGLAFDRQGGRIGYGGGYYDRYLERLQQNKSVHTTALAFDFQVVEKVPCDENDKRYHLLVTEKCHCHI